MFNLVTEENFVLTLGDAAATHKISSLTFNHRTNHLAAGTAEVKKNPSLFRANTPITPLDLLTHLW